MITVKLTFPPPARYVSALRYGFSTPGSERTAKIAFPPPARYVSALRYGFSKPGSERTAKLTFPPPARYGFSKPGSERTAKIAFPPPVRYVSALRYGFSTPGSERTAKIAFPPPVRYVSALRYGFSKPGSERTAKITFPPPVWIFQHAQIRYSYDVRNFQHSKILYGYDYKNFAETKISFSYDWIRRVITKFSWSKSVFVRAGWRIMARNLETNEMTELGFIDESESVHTLTGISLPDGDYEITVLTSRLYWKDCRDKNRLTISVRAGLPVTLAFPVIYDLRTLISAGIRRLEWSATRGSDTDDFEFGLWLSETSPVDVSGVPIKTIMYDPLRAEYRTTILQTEPLYAALAVIRTSGETESRGIPKEIFLEWNTILPHSPDDFIVR